MVVIPYEMTLEYDGKEHKSFGYLAYSHHDRFPPWWGFVCNDIGGDLSGDKIPP